MQQGRVLKFLWPVAILLWSCFILLLGWEQHRKQNYFISEIIKAEAKGSYNKDLVYRRWVAKHGGVYVPVSEYTPPNPYLNIPNRDVTTTTGQQLTLVNPAYMTRQVYQLAATQYGSQGHITSLNPIRPENAPDEWESSCLETFKKGETEVSSEELINDKSYMRYMRYMLTEKGCVKCHAHQGYKVGDVRGGISISIPLEQYRQAQTALFKTTVKQLLVLWALGLLFFLYFRRVVLRQITSTEAAQLKAELSERKYRLIFDEMNIGFSLIDLKTCKRTECNKYLAELIGSNPAQATQQAQKLFSISPSQNSADLPYFEYLRQSAGEIVGAQLTTSTGEIKEVEIQAQPITMDEHSFLLCMVMDVTERKMLEQQSFRLLCAIDQCPIAVLLTNINGTAIYANSYFIDKKGFSLADCRDPDNPLQQMVQTWIENIAADSNLSTENSTWVEEHQALCKDGSTYWERTTFSSVLDGDGQVSYYLVIGEDISAEKDNALQFEYHATHDLLTGLGNRLHLQDRVDQALLQVQQSSKAVYLLLLDIDRFKVVNDSLGHGTGDLLLQIIAQRLKETVGIGDIVVRLGGDEFAVLVTAPADPTYIKSLPAKIRTTISEPMLIHGYNIIVTASIGICSYPEHGTNCEELIRYADIAMYHAKKSGQLICFYEDMMGGEAVETMQVETELREVLNSNELEVYYQPKVDTKSKQIYGFEALLRWKHPDKGMISPEVFIPIAEQTGLIIDIGRWVLKNVCQQISAWQKAGLHVDPVAVNLSAKQFQNLSLLADIQSILAASGVTAQQLEFEITESTIMQDPDMTIEIINEMKSLGLKVALDDFGTGYSSFNYLRKFPLDYLKIDRSFIDNLTQDKSADSVADSIVSIAHKLGMQAIAEGVETVEQLDFLHKIDCDFIQGYYFYRPLPAAEIGSLLRPARK